MGSVPLQRCRAGLAALALLGFASAAPLSEGWCQQARVTGYSRFEHSTHTYDGTPILADEPIAAASWNIPLGWLVEIPEVGVFRVADRGSGLGSSGWVDVAVWSREEAFALTSTRVVCVYPPEGI